jgi:hypothetical protein
MIRRITGVLLLVAAIAGGACTSSPPADDPRADNEKTEAYQRARDSLPMR